MERGYQKEGTIRRSTLQNKEIRRTVENTATAENNPQIRRKGDLSDALTSKRSGAKSIAPMDMIWKNAKLFWITKRCHLQQCWHPKIPARGSIAGRSPMEMSIWRKLT
jgi:type IV secretory pathway VirB4 component